jgi:hypothetical protein
MSHAENENDSPRILVVPKEVGGLSLPILCFLVGMLNFALLANVVNNFKMSKQKDVLPTEEVQQLTAERLPISRTNTRRTQYRKRIINR